MKNNLKFKTLVYKHNTEYQEFVGYDYNIGWCTSQKPINLFNEDITIDEIPKLTEFHNYDNLKLITVELNLLNDEEWKEDSEQELKAEIKYSEDEVRKLLMKALTHTDYNLCGALVTAQHEIRTANFNVWFEEYKKK